MIYFRPLLKPLLGGTSCWDCRPPKRQFEREPLSACSECEERGNKHRGKKGRGTQRQNESAVHRIDKMDSPLSGRGFVRLAGMPRPDKGG